MEPVTRLNVTKQVKSAELSPGRAVAGCHWRGSPSGGAEVGVCGGNSAVKRGFRLHGEGGMRWEPGEAGSHEPPPPTSGHIRDSG